MFNAIIVCSLLLSTAGFAFAQKPTDAEFTKLSAELQQSYAKGDYPKALAAAERLAELAIKAEGTRGLALAKVLRNRGMIEKAQGDLKRARTSFEKAIDIFRDHKNTLSKVDAALLADALEAVGIIRAPGELLRIEGIFEEALEWREKAHGPDAAKTATPLVQLANINFWRRDYKKAASLYSRALKNLASSASPNTEDVTFVFFRTECSYRKASMTEKFAEIRSLYESGAKYTPGEPRKAKLINGGVVNGKALHLEKPVWPAEARSSPIAEGSVGVEILINEHGKVISACGVQSDTHIALVEASEIAAYKSTFSPTTLAGQPVKVTGRIHYNFRRTR